jgi:Arc/MetJ-type ribon-helix-helix transcriptional regulator
MAATKHTSMRLTATDRRRLDRLAVARRASRSDVVRTLLAQADREAPAAETPAERRSSTTPALDEGSLVAAVVAGAEVNWRAAAWLLERRWPERWATRRTQAEAEPGPEPIAAADDDAFAEAMREVDEIARQRRKRPR